MKKAMKKAPEHVLEVLRDPPSEEVLIRMIERSLITPLQSRILSGLGLSIWHILNGHYPAGNREVASVLRSWNRAVGEEIFFVLD